MGIRGLKPFAPRCRKVTRDTIRDRNMPDRKELERWLFSEKTGPEEAAEAAFARVFAAVPKIEPGAEFAERTTGSSMARAGTPPPDCGPWVGRGRRHCGCSQPRGLRGSGTRGSVGGQKRRAGDVACDAVAAGVCDRSDESLVDCGAHRKPYCGGHRDTAAPRRSSAWSLSGSSRSSPCSGWFDWSFEERRTYETTGGVCGCRAVDRAVGGGELRIARADADRGGTAQPARGSPARRALQRGVALVPGAWRTRA